MLSERGPACRVPLSRNAVVELSLGAPPHLENLRLVFIDEASVTTKMARHSGRSPRGERVVASVSHGHWKTLTFIAALRISGLTAPYAIDGAMDGDPGLN